MDAPAAAGYALIGVGAGLIAGYLWAEKVTKTEYEARAKRDMEEAKAYYAKLHKAEGFQSPREALTALVPEEEQEKLTTRMLEERAIKATQRYRPADIEVKKADIEDEPVEKNVFVSPNADSDSTFDFDERDGKTKFVITKDEFMRNESEYEQVTLTYFDGDDVLVDSEEKPVDDELRLIGDGNLRFGYGSGDHNVVYIRNETLQLEFEVLKSSGNYAEEVLGFIQHSDRPRLRKFRGDDD